jgi:hypothetical protein
MKKRSEIGPGEHPADEPCGGLCEAQACMDAAFAEMGVEGATPKQAAQVREIVTEWRTRSLGRGGSPARAFGGGTAIVLSPPPGSGR